jgi:hypothetical protein
VIVFAGSRTLTGIPPGTAGLARPVWQDRCATPALARSAQSRCRHARRGPGRPRRASDPPCRGLPSGRWQRADHEFGGGASSVGNPTAALRAGADVGGETPYGDRPTQWRSPSSTRSPNRYAGGWTLQWRRDQWCGGCGGDSGQGADLGDGDARALDLTWMACMPSVSSCRQARAGPPEGARCWGPARKTPCGVPYVHQDRLRQGRLVVREVERSSTSSEVA